MLIFFLILPWSFLFCRSVSYFVVVFLILPWSFLFCGGVSYFAVEFLILWWRFLFCRGVSYFAVTVVGHRRNSMHHLRSAFVVESCRNFRNKIFKYSMPPWRLPHSNEFFGRRWNSDEGLWFIRVLAGGVWLKCSYIHSFWQGCCQSIKRSFYLTKCSHFESNHYHYTRKDYG